MKLITLPWDDYKLVNEIKDGNVKWSLVEKLIHPCKDGTTKFKFLV
jgi:hypothetical protein